METTQLKEEEIELEPALRWRGRYSARDWEMGSRAAALAPAAVPPSTSTVMNQWPRRVALCCVRWSFIYFGVSTATKSHLPVVLTTPSQGTNWAFSSRFQLQFGNEEEEVEERRIAFTTDPLSPPSLSSSCQLTVSHSLKMTSLRERHRRSRPPPCQAGRPFRCTWARSGAKFRPESRFKQFFHPERNPVTFLSKWECKKWPLCHSLSLSPLPRPLGHDKHLSDWTSTA